MDKQAVGDAIIKAADALEKPRCWPRLGGFVFGLALGILLAIEMAFRHPSLVQDRVFVFMCEMVAYPFAVMLMWPAKARSKSKAATS
jgi:hypothetical protein